MKSSKVIASVRKNSGSADSRRLRMSGKVPGIIYGSDSNPVNIILEHNAMRLALEVESFHSSILDIDVEGKTEKVLLRDFQVHPYKPQVIHVDFQRVDEAKELHTSVPVHFVGEQECPAVKMAGGTISHVANEINIKCLPKDLPEYIEVDLRDLEIGNSIHLNELKLPVGIKLVDHGQDNPVIAAAIKPKGVVEDEIESSATSEDQVSDDNKESTEEDKS